MNSMWKSVLMTGGALGILAACSATVVSSGPPPTDDGGTTDTGTGSTGCTGLCNKANNVASCPSQATCLSQCQNPQGLPPSCQTQYNTFVSCAGGPSSTLTSCATNQYNVSGCDNEYAALLSCATPGDSGVQDSGTGTDTGSGGDGGSCGTITVGTSPNCQPCMNTNCCSQLGACSNDTNCTNLITCLQPCFFADGGADQTCENNCGNTAGQTAISEYNAIGQCLQSSCSTVCP
jgi:hypothetical protein